MDKYLFRPRELSAESESPDAARTLSFWLRTVEDFIDSLRELRGADDPEVNRKCVIIGCRAPSVFPHVEDGTYEEVVRILKLLRRRKIMFTLGTCSLAVSKLPEKPSQSSCKL